MVTFREALDQDIPQMITVRSSVNENRLSNPNIITREDYQDYMFNRGKGWVCEVDNTIVGFAIADLKTSNIWALFVLPQFEKKGIGRRLHNMMLNWYFKHTNKPAWLRTEPTSRAETFYRKAGWIEVGHAKSGEIEFEMTCEAWRKLNENKRTF